MEERMRLGIVKYLLVFSVVITACSCGGDPDDPPYTGEEKDQWVATEYAFTSSYLYDDSFNDVDVDVIFTHEDGTEILMPSFWDGDSIWRVRFAPTLEGIWSYETVCTDTGNEGLHGQTGDFKCIRYVGPLVIYKKGFLNVESGTRYFTYSDGSPFFYLSDAHMNIVANEMDNFKTIVDKRVEQGFTAVASEPLEVDYYLSNGITAHDVRGFQSLDERFQYVAEKGLVHANSQFFFVSELGYLLNRYPDEYLEKLSRYWVARYGAYPVLWTTAQECDNDYKFPPHSDHDYFTAETNPWKRVAGFIHKHDPYNHPLTAHMEYVSFTMANTSSFREVEGHNWWGVQWSPVKNGVMNFGIPKNFWDQGQEKVTILYEGSFDYLWTNHFGSRMQGWSAFLNGMYGYGYGAADIWLYNSTYNMDVPTTRDGITITVEMKQTKWPEALEFETGYQMGYMKDFLMKNQWWELVPRFGDSQWFDNLGSYFVLASKGSEIYVVYFYNIGQRTGRIRNVENASYTVQWFNPRTGITESSEAVTISSGSYDIGNKPDGNDWVLLMKKN